MGVAITGLAAPVQDASITFVLRGGIGHDLLALLDAPKLGLVSAQGIGRALARRRGRAARAHLVLPITAQGTPFEAVNFAAAANLADVQRIAALCPRPISTAARCRYGSTARASRSTARSSSRTRP